LIVENRKGIRAYGTRLKNWGVGVILTLPEKSNKISDLA